MIMEDHPLCALMYLAAAYGGFSCFPLDPDMDGAHIDELKRSFEALGMSIGATLGREDIADMIEAFGAPDQEALDSQAQRFISQFNDQAPALWLFDDVSGRPHPVTWHALSKQEQGYHQRMPLRQGELIQLALPLRKLEGTQALVRCLVRGMRCALYAQGSYDCIFDDALAWDADILITDREGFDYLMHAPQAALELLGEVEDVHAGPEKARTPYAKHATPEDAELLQRERRAALNASLLAFYRLVVIEDGPISQELAEEALSLSIVLMVAFSHPLLGGPIALSQITPTYRGGLKLLPGFEVTIQEADTQGWGQGFCPSDQPSCCSESESQASLMLAIPGSCCLRGRYLFVRDEA